ncbi:hypothetical protein ACUN0G_32915 [Pseudomonas sp. 32A]|uniref:hypothetical protein n=1 Tax=Pseudomonas sp. 32A TaxID=651185 RepID=UPI00404583A3
MSVLQKVYGDEGISSTTSPAPSPRLRKPVVTHDAPFDRRLKGDKKTISPTVLQGYQLLKSIGCVACHYREAVGSGLFQKMGTVDPYAIQNPAQGVSGLISQDAAGRS